MIKRILCDFLMMFLLFWAPWYATAFIGTIFIIIFKNYWEGALAAIIVDSLYSLPSSGIKTHFGVFTLSALALVCASEYIKNRIRVM